MPCRLRRIREADLECVRQWRMLPEITRFMYTDPEITPEQQRAWFAGIAASARDCVWIIELVDGDIPVGLLSLSEIDRVHRRCAWAYYLADPRARGKGLAKVLELNVYAHVFETLGLNRLWCEVLGSNERVVQIHERFGSRVEGILREHVLKHGEAHDVVRMAMLARDWPAIREKFSFQTIEIEP